MRRLLALLLVAAASLPGTAHANGDPASDVLPFQNVFLSVQDPRRSSAGRELIGLTADARKKKYPIKVAVIAQRSDLGLVPSMWRKPQLYANFLGRELILFARYRGTLVIGMPDGFGVFGPGATPPAKAALAKLPKPGTSDAGEVGEATADAVRRVAAANGHPVSAPASGFPAWAIVLAAVGGAVIIGAGGYLALRRWLLKPASR